MNKSLTMALIAFLTSLSAFANWPQWRGPAANNFTGESTFPSEFSPKKNVLWAVKLQGRGTSTPAEWDGQIFVTLNAGKREALTGDKTAGDDRRSPGDRQDVLICFDIDGKELWTKRLGDARPERHKVASGSNPSPVVDEMGVVAYFKSGRVAAFSHDGKPQWETNLQDEVIEDHLWWDLGTSPVLHDGKVIIALMQQKNAFVVALDRKSGKTEWKSRRNLDAPKESNDAYTTPIVATVDGKEQLICWGADHLTGHSLDNGKLLWQCGDFNPSQKGNWRVISSPLVHDGMAVVSYGRGGFLAGIKMGGSGNITSRAWAWQKSRLPAADVPSIARFEDLCIVLSDRGNLTAFNIKTGEKAWEHSLKRSKDRYYSSPVVAGNRVISCRVDGTVFVGEVSKNGYKELSTNVLGEGIIATAVPLEDRLLLRTMETLYAFGK